MGNHYELTGFSSQGENTNKVQIILADTKRDYINYINSLKYRYNKKNPHLPNYVVTKNGDIYMIMKPEEYSNFMDDKKLDKNSIIVVLENHGYLNKNPLDNTYINWIGDIYKKEVFQKKWRDSFFWEPYNDKQIKNLTELIKKLCNDFNIPKKCIGHNVKDDDVRYFKGVVSKSNYDFLYKDVNPSFDFKLFKQMLENDQ